MAAAVLVSLAQAKGSLRITTPDGHPGDADLQLKLDTAEAFILKYLKSQADPSWTAETVPPTIQTAITYWLGYLDSDRGDNPKDAADAWNTVVRMLALYRDPALA